MNLLVLILYDNIMQNGNNNKIEEKPMDGMIWTILVVVLAIVGALYLFRRV